MPRRRPKDDLQELNAAPPLMLPPVRPSHRRHHEEDAYEAPPGSVVVRELKSEPIKREQTPEDKQNRSIAAADRKMRGQRYLRYLDAMTEHGGNEVLALAQVYAITEEAVQTQLDSLLMDVRSGLGATSLAEELERNDLAQHARIRRLRAHVYSENPAASLKALDMVSEIDGGRQELGSFEDYVRLAKSQRGG